MLDPRRSAPRVRLQRQLLGFSLVLVGVARAWGEFDRSNVLTWLVVGGMALSLVAVLVQYVRVEARRAP